MRTKEDMLSAAAKRSGVEPCPVWERPLGEDWKKHNSWTATVGNAIPEGASFTSLAADVLRLTIASGGQR